MRAVHVGMGWRFARNAGRLVGIVVDAVRIDTDGNGNIMDFGVTEELVRGGLRAGEHYRAVAR